ncbi:L-type lectin-domain containing protein [Actinoplanes sp. KI2]|uniref:L-type lectin-domain containing protein n=1 Tax=Actinoplanes sp. KI2 TaxID=2983315 RepID=UPI0021D5C35C|nr:L-type lectin-domain containing protein [Actinoplanes sp. KI2]MCU7726615.1 L-type lectin-domain containing protein [Actinoplanes sp. KI2]
MSSGYRSMVYGGLLAAALSISVAPAPALAAGASTGTGRVTAAKPPGFRLNGTATMLSNNRIRLTNGGYQQMGSAWLTDQIDVTRSFVATFRASLLGVEDRGADGVAFVVQSVGPRALGGWGGGLGYRGVRPSVAVELDDFQNAPDPAGDHIGIVLGGNPDVHLATAPTAKPLYGNTTTVKVVYDASAHRLLVFAGKDMALDQRVDVARELGAGRAWVGFTGATGDLTSIQDITNWAVVTGR